MQITGTFRESHNTSVLWEKQEENGRLVFVLKIILGTLAYALKFKKCQIFDHSVLFVGGGPS